jgi:hypothetical protein
VKHFLLLLALMFGAQPVLAGTTANGGTVLAVIILGVWGWLVWDAHCSTSERS